MNHMEEKKSMMFWAKDGVNRAFVWENSIDIYLVVKSKKKNLLYVLILIIGGLISWCIWD